MPDTNQISRRPVADYMALLLSVLAIVGSMGWTTTSLRNEMNANFGAVDQRFDSMEIRMDTQFEATNERLDRMDDRFDRMDDRFDRMDDRFDRMDDRMDGIDEQLRQIIGRLYDLNTRLTRVETGIFGYEPPDPLETPSGDDPPPEPDSVADL